MIIGSGSRPEELSATRAHGSSRRHTRVLEFPSRSNALKVQFPLLQDQRSIPLTCSSSDATVGGSMLDAFSRISEMIAATLFEV
jgi:hypothetical protein